MYYKFVVPTFGHCCLWIIKILDTPWDTSVYLAEVV